MPLYAAHYEMACMTRQQLEQLAARAAAAAGECRPDRFFVSLTGGHLVWLFVAPDRARLEEWLGRLQMQNHQWLARIDLEGEGNELRDR